MSYREWKEKFTSGNKRGLLSNSKNDVIIENKKKDKLVDEVTNKKEEQIGKKEKSTAKKVDIEYKVVDSKLEKDLQKRSDKIWKKMLYSEQNAIVEYSGVDYGITNRYLRNALYEDDDIEWNKTVQRVRELDRVLSKNILGDDLILYRGVDFKEFNAWKDSEIIDTYKSSSISKETFDRFGDGHKIIIRVPKKTKGFYLGKYSDFSSEKEFLIHRNQKYRVIKVEEDVMEVEIIA